MSGPARIGAPSVAFVSPLPPERSGVADHSGSLLPHLAELFDVDAYTADPERSAAALRCGMPLRRYADFPHTARGVAIYQLGNHATHHADVYRLAMRRPGIAVLHEYVLHDLVRDCALDDGGPSAYAEELRYCLGGTGERLAAYLRAGGERLSPHAWPLFEHVVDSSLAVVVHSRAARDRIARSRPLATVRVVPLLLPPPADFERKAAELRHELEIPEGALLFGAFGVAAAAKRLDVVLLAFERLARTGRDDYLLVAGPESTRFMRERGGLPAAVAERVRILDRVPLDTLQAAMAATDVAFNLRFPTGGETSDTCLRLLGLGRPVVVSDAGWFAEIPDDACAKVRPDALEEPTLDALLGALAARPELRRALGDNGRRWALAEHAVERVVAGYAEVVAEVAGARAGHRAPAALAAADPADIEAELLADVAAALGDLGVTEADTDILDGVARVAAQVGLGTTAGSVSGGRAAAAAPPGPGSRAEERS